MDLSEFSKKRILVVGDIMLDWYLDGKITRLNPEEPGAPEIDITNNKYVLGGAANVAANIASLGGHASLLGVVGNDQYGKEIERLCKIYGIFPILLIDEKRPTTIKLRLMAGKRHIARASMEDRTPISECLEEKCASFLNGRRDDVILISDYNKGLLTQKVSKKIIEYSKRTNTLTLVDPKPENIMNFQEADLICPNLEEAKKIVGNLADYEDIGKALKEKIDCKYALVTCGENGMFCYNDNGFHRVNTVAKAVYDVSGAGDTVIASMALALSSGYSIEGAMDIANHAAGIVVGKIGTATCSIDELTEAIKNEKQTRNS